MIREIPTPIPIPIYDPTIAFESKLVPLASEVEDLTELVKGAAVVQVVDGADVVQVVQVVGGADAVLEVVKVAVGVAALAELRDEVGVEDVAEVVGSEAVGEEVGGSHSQRGQNGTSITMN